MVKFPTQKIPTPDRTLERGLNGPVAGVDEAGCAPLAGPVVAAAVILPPGAEDNADLCGLNDSKLLSRSNRDRLFAVITRIGYVGVGAASVAEIDRINIRAADMLAMRRAVLALPTKPRHVLVDGNGKPTLPMPVTTVVQGDRLCLAIAAASVIAKVTRDRIMAALALRYPAYGWDANAGYPAPDHYIGLLEEGVTPHHRRTFAPLKDLDADGRPVFGEWLAAPELNGDLVTLRRDQVVLLSRAGSSIGVSKSRIGAGRVTAIFRRRQGYWTGRAIAGPDGRVPDALIGLNDIRLPELTPATLIAAIASGST